MITVVKRQQHAGVAGGRPLSPLARLGHGGARLALAARAVGHRPVLLNPCLAIPARGGMPRVLLVPVETGARLFQLVCALHASEADSCAPALLVPQASRD